MCVYIIIIFVIVIVPIMIIIMIMMLGKPGWWVGVVKRLGWWVVKRERIRAVMFSAANLLGL